MTPPFGASPPTKHLLMSKSPAFGTQGRSAFGASVAMATIFILGHRNAEYLAAPALRRQAACRGQRENYRAASSV